MLYATMRIGNNCEYFLFQSNLEILNCKECHELTTVDLSNNLKVRIGDEMFYTCSKLSKIVLPNNILEIGESAFYGCI